MKLHDIKKLLIHTVLLGAGLVCANQSMAADNETLVFIRHGEKPLKGKKGVLANGKKSLDSLIVKVLSDECSI